MYPKNTIANTLFVTLCACMIVALGSCDDEVASPPAEETISTPAALTGPHTIEIQNTGLYCCSGASSSEGHELEHQYDWGDSSTSDWAVPACASHAWSSTGSRSVKVRARCRVHTGKVSSWSNPYSVEVTDPLENISTPEVPSGPLFCVVGQPEFFYTGDATSSLGHDVQYHFDWGDGRTSPWSYSDSASNGWAANGTYTVRAQARCAAHTHVISPWSGGTDVDAVLEVISPPPNPPSGHDWVCPDQMRKYVTGDAASSIGDSLEYRFDWGDGSISAWSSSTSEMHSWPVRDDYVVRAQARCAIHTSIVSVWSGGLTVKINETLSTPPAPNGPSSSRVGVTDNYCRGTARSDCLHPVEHQWSVGQELSEWGAASCRMITWTSSGLYDVKVRGRCSIHTDVRSPWSRAVTVTVSD